MRVIRDFSTLKRDDMPSVVTIGNFDGVHRGHQSIFKQINGIAKQCSGRSVVILFEPQPAEFFNPAKAPARLSSMKEKIALMQQHNIDLMLVLRFNRSFAAMDGLEFCQRILVEGLKARHVIIGDDFRFAKDRSAGIDELKQFGLQYDFTVEQANRCEFQNKRISSSWIRTLLADGDFATVSSLLGRNYSVCGRVIHGDKRGRKLGYPTANIRIRRLNPALSGVYVTATRIGTSVPVPSVSNFGTRPMFDGHQLLLETHLLDYQGDLYGQTIDVEFLKHLRPEKKLESLTALKKQIDLDSQNAREFHGVFNAV